MAQGILFGSDASVTMPTGMGAFFRAFSLTISQQVARAVGFGSTWVAKKGTGAREAVGNVAGYTTKGTTSDKPGISNIIQSGSAATLTFYTGCTLTLNMIFSSVSVGAEFEANATSAYAFEADITGVSETWVTT